MKDTVVRKNLGEKKIEYRRHPLFSFALTVFLLVIIFMISSYFYPDTPFSWIVYSSVWIILVLFMILRSPRSITIDGDELKIKWIVKTTIINKNNIHKISKWKFHPDHCMFRIIKIPDTMKKRIFKTLPVFVVLGQKPDPDLEPLGVYNIAEEIEKWLINGSVDHNPSH